MSDNNWLRESLTRIENKVDNMDKTLGQAVTDIALNKQCYHSLYGALESHKVESCAKVADGIKGHNEAAHKDLGGKVFGYVVAIITILAVIIAGVWALASYVMK